MYGLSSHLNGGSVGSTKHRKRKQEIKLLSLNLLLSIYIHYRISIAIFWREGFDITSWQLLPAGGPTNKKDGGPRRTF